MSETIKGLLVILVGGAVMLYFLILFLGGKSRKDRLFCRAREQGWVTTGYLVRDRRTAGSIARGNRIREYKWNGISAVYRYTVKGKTYRIRTQTRKGDPDHGANAVKVYYDPKHPRRAVTRTTVAAGKAAWLLAMALTMLSMFLTAQVLNYFFPEV